MVRRRVTFSRNLTLSLSRTCRCYCKYCAFATHKAHLYAPDEVNEILDGAAKRQVKELLVLTGEHPEVNPEVRARLAEYGHEDFTAYVVWTCERALERGLLPHTNLGVLSREDLARLREVTASQGLMLESVAERLMQTVHAGSPTKHPRRRLETIEAAGELKIPFTSGILVGIGETEEERIESIEALAAVHARHGHIQEVILQNFVPHQSYYGEEPAEIADQAAREYWVDENPTHPDEDLTHARPELPLPDWACAVSIEDMKRLIRETRRLMPDVGIQIPPNLADWWGELVQTGATDLGGSERERRSHLTRAPVSFAAPGAQAAAGGRYGADRAAVRVPAVHRSGVDRAGGDGHNQGQVLELHPQARLRPHRPTRTDPP